MYDDPVSRALAVIRQHYDDGGDVEPLMSRVIEGVGDRAIRDKRVLDPEAVLKPGPEQSVWEKISSKFMGDRPSPERRRFVEGVGDIADVAHMGAYATPLAPYVGAADFASGVASGDPMEAVLGATGLPGRAAKAAGVAASAMMPGEAEAGPLSNALKAIRAYHGSPHKFDKFDISKIGTGEGAQAYGHGLYFAGNEGVARSYRDALGRDAILVDGNKIIPKTGTPEDIALAHLVNAHYNRYSNPWGIADKGIRNNMAELEGKPEYQTKYLNARNVLADWQERGAQPTSSGHMYEVDIHADPSHMLDWDKPLMEQPEAVRRLAGWTPEAEEEYQAVRSSDTDRLLAALEGDGNYIPTKLPRPKGALPADTLGANIYESSKLVPGDYRDKVAASHKLRDVGIPGIKYLDQGSRGSGEGTSNYVVFDPNLIEILRRYKDGGSVGPQE